MKWISFALLLLACQPQNFDADKRQLVAKDEMLRLLPPGSTHLTVYSFAQDTAYDYPDPNIRKPIKYALRFSYTDSAGRNWQQVAQTYFPQGSTVPLITRFINLQ